MSLRRGVSRPRWLNRTSCKTRPGGYTAQTESIQVHPTRMWNRWKCVKQLGRPGDVSLRKELIEEKLNVCTSQMTKQSGTQVATRNIHWVDAAVVVVGNPASVTEDIGADLIVAGTHAPRTLTTCFPAMLVIWSDMSTCRSLSTVWAQG